MHRDIESDHHETIRLEDKIAALLRPDTHAEPPGVIDAIETHMSWIVRTDRYAYKLKKPVRTVYLDFSTLEARHHRCEDEVRLNRRLAGDVYIGAVALTVSAHGVRINGRGTVIDWLVKMRRLPDARMLDRLLQSGSRSTEALVRAADKLARFYAHARPVAMRPSRHFHALVTDIDRTWQVLALSGYDLPKELLYRACGLQLEAARRLREILEARVRDGKLVEGHGDLRPEHVCLIEPEPVIIDCIEFNRTLRTLDPADDLGFLSLECERLGAPHVHSTLFDSYRRITGDNPSDELVHFYQSYRAALRAKLAVWHLDEPRFRDSEKWRNRTLAYVALAELHAQQVG